MSSYLGEEAAQFRPQEQAQGYGVAAALPALPQQYGYSQTMPYQVQARSAAVAVVASLFILQAPQGLS